MKRKKNTKPNENQTSHNPKNNEISKKQKAPQSNNAYFRPLDVVDNIVNINNMDFNMCEQTYNENHDVTGAPKQFIGVRSGFAIANEVKEEERMLLIDHISIKNQENIYLKRINKKMGKIKKNKQNDNYDCLSLSTTNEKINNSLESISSSSDNNSDISNSYLIDSCNDEQEYGYNNDDIDEEMLRLTKKTICDNCEICKVTLIDNIKSIDSSTNKLVRILNSSINSGNNTQLINLVYDTRKELIETPNIKSSIPINFWSKAMLYFHVNGNCNYINTVRVNNTNIQTIQKIMAHICENEIICEDQLSQKIIDKDSLDKLYKCGSILNKCLLLNKQLQNKEALKERPKKNLK